MLIFFSHIQNITFVPYPFTVNVPILPQQFLTHSIDTFIHTFGKGYQ